MGRQSAGLHTCGSPHCQRCYRSKRAALVMAAAAMVVELPSLAWVRRHTLGRRPSRSHPSTGTRSALPQVESAGRTRHRNPASLAESPSPAHARRQGKRARHLQRSSQLGPCQLHQRSSRRSHRNHQSQVHALLESHFRCPNAHQIRPHCCSPASPCENRLPRARRLGYRTTQMNHWPPGLAAWTTRGVSSSSDWTLFPPQVLCRSAYL